LAALLVSAVALVTGCNNVPGTSKAEDRARLEAMTAEPALQLHLDGYTVDEPGGVSATSGGTWNHPGSAFQFWTPIRNDVDATAALAALRSHLLDAGWQPAPGDTAPISRFAKILTSSSGQRFVVGAHLGGLDDGRINLGLETSAAVEPYVSPDTTVPPATEPHPPPESTIM
jgi:hypothetical protein